MILPNRPRRVRVEIEEVADFRRPEQVWEMTDATFGSMLLQNEAEGLPSEGEVNEVRHRQTHEIFPELVEAIQRLEIRRETHRLQLREAEARRNVHAELLQRMRIQLEHLATARGTHRLQLREDAEARRNELAELLRIQREEIAIVQETIRLQLREEAEARRNVGNEAIEIPIRQLPSTFDRHMRPEQLDEAWNQHVEQLRHQGEIAEVADDSSVVASEAAGGPADD